MAGRPSDRRYQLAAQKRNEAALKFDYYSQTAKYFARESGKARQFNAWNVNDLKSNHLENIRKAETFRTRQTKLRDLLKLEEEIYGKEKEQSKFRKSTREEFSIEALQEKLRERRTEQNLYNSRTCRRIQSYFANPTQAEKASILKEVNNPSKLEGNQAPKRMSQKSMDMSDDMNCNITNKPIDSSLNSQMKDFNIRANEYKENREASNGSNMSCFYKKSHSENDSSKFPCESDDVNGSKNLAPSTRDRQQYFSGNEDEIDGESPGKYGLGNDYEQSSNQVIEGHEKPYCENDQPSRTEQHKTYLDDQESLEDSSSTRSVHQHKGNNLHHTEAFDIRAQEFRDNQSAGEGTNIAYGHEKSYFQNEQPPRTEKRDFYMEKQTFLEDDSSDRPTYPHTDNNLHHTEAFDIRAQEFKDNQSAGEGSHFSFGHEKPYFQNEEPSRGSDKSHIYMGNQTFLEDDSSTRPVHQQVDNNLHHTKAFDIRAQEFKDNQSAGEGSHFMFGHEKPYFQNEEPPRGSDKNHIYMGNQTFLEDDSSTRPVHKQTDNNLHHTKAFDIRAQEFKDNQSAGEGSHFMFGHGKPYSQNNERSHGSDIHQTRNGSSIKSNDTTKRNNLQHTDAFDIRAQEFKNNQMAGEGTHFSFGTEKPSYQNENQRRGSNSSGGSSGSSKKSLENHWLFEKQDNASSQQNKKFTERYNRKSLEGTNVRVTSKSREATPSPTEKDTERRSISGSHCSTPVYQYNQSNDNRSSGSSDKVDNSVYSSGKTDTRDEGTSMPKQHLDKFQNTDNDNRNYSQSMLAYLTSKNLKAQILDLERRESRATNKQEWEDALRLREMRNNLELFLEKKLYEQEELPVGSEERKTALTRIENRVHQLAERANFCENTEMYSEEARLTWKKWDREDEKSALIEAEAQREKLVGQLEKEWQVLASDEKTRISKMFEKIMASTFQHELCLLAKLAHR